MTNTQSIKSKPTTTEQTKNRARALFDTGHHAEAFDMLWSVGIAEFVAYGVKTTYKTTGAPPKTNWFTDAASRDSFWNTFLSDEEKFHLLFQSAETDEILHYYFSIHNFASSSFEQRLASHYPELLVRVVKVNAAFLHEARIGSLCALSLSEPYHVHQVVWRNLYDKEKWLWQQVEEAWKDTNNASLKELLWKEIAWLEHQRFNKYNNTQELHRLATIYSLFIELVLDRFPIKKLQLPKEETFTFGFEENIVQDHNQKVKPNQFPLLKAIDAWIQFSEGDLAAYCYQAFTHLEEDKGNIYLITSPEAHYQWQIDALRYELLRLLYFDKAGDMVEVMEENGETIPGKAPQTNEENRRLHTQLWMTLMALDDLNLPTFKFEKQDIDASALLNPLLSYSYNRQLRYEQTLERHAKGKKSWTEAFVTLTIESVQRDIRMEPYLLMTIAEYHHLIEQVITRLSEDDLKALTGLFTYERSDAQKFNRFERSYDVWRHPFVKLDDQLFSPIMFFANNNWFYPFMNAAFEARRKRQETEEMETTLGETFEKRGWKVKVIDQKQEKQFPNDGDIDLIVEDDHDILFIQLKRTGFAITEKQRYLESIHGDKKARQQIENASAFLRAENPIHPVKPGLCVHQWLVSTSFEKSGWTHKTVRKINYFDLLFLLLFPLKNWTSQAAILKL